MVVGGGSDGPMVYNCGSIGMGHGSDGSMVVVLVPIGCGSDGSMVMGHGSQCDVFNGSWVMGPIV